MAIVFKQAVRDETKAADPSSMDFILSDGTVDRMGDIIEPDGWQLSNFRKNPVALYGHDASALPVGRWKNVRVEGKRLIGTLQLAAAGTSRFIDALRSLIEQGIIKAVSVGFQPIEYEPIDEKNPWDGLRFTKQELMECSLVTVPANPNAVALRSLAPNIRQRLAASGAAPVETFVRPKKPAARGATPSQTGKTQMKIKERIAAKVASLEELRNKLAPIVKKISDDDELTDVEQEEFDTLQAEIDATEKDLRTLRAAEKQLGIASDVIESTPRNRPPGVPATITAPGVARSVRSKDSPFDLLVRSFIVFSQAHVMRQAPDDVIKQRFSGRDDIAAVYRAVTNPARTDTAGWAEELVGEAILDFIEQLLPVSVYGPLSAAGVRFSFGVNGRVIVPRRDRVVGAAGDLAGAFVGEGMPIPVRRGQIGSVTLTPHKLGVISTFTREMAQRSTPQIEGIIRQGIIEDTADAIDRALLDDLPGTVIRPAGLGFGVVPIPPTAGGDDAAVQADVRAMLAPFIAANAAKGLVWLMNSGSRSNLSMMTNPLGLTSEFQAQARAGELGGFPIIDSTNVAIGDLWLVRAADFMSANGDTPVFDVSDQATIHEVDAYSADGTAGPTVLPISTGAAGAAVVATPVRSLWQTATTGVRMLMDMDWEMRRAGMVQKIEGISW